MRALVCTELGPPDRLTIEELPDPEPAPGEVVVDVRAAGVNFPDLLMIAGKYQVELQPPFVPGGEGAGVVAQVGEGVARFGVGDPVIFTSAIDGASVTGAFAERAAVPEGQLIAMPRSLSFDQAGGFSITYGTAYHALKQRAAIQPGETLLVLGAAGGVGAATVEVGKAMGARVIAAASTPAKLAFATELGADDVVDYTAEDLKARVRELTDGQGADVVFDPVGGAHSEAAIRATAWDGRFLVIGFAAGEIPKIPLNLPLLKGLSIVGVFWGAWATRDPATARQNFAELFTLVDAGQLDPRVSEAYELEEQAEAFRSIAERRAMGKVVIRFGRRST